MFSITYQPIIAYRDIAKRARDLLKKMLAVKPILQSALQSRELARLEEALEKAMNVEFKMKLIADCEKLKLFILKEKIVTKHLQDLIGNDTGDKKVSEYEKIADELRSVLQEADEIGLEIDLVQTGKKIIAIVQRKKDIIAALVESTQKLDRAKMEDAVQKAFEIGLDESEPSLIKAQEEIQRIIMEEDLTERLEASIHSGSAQPIGAPPFTHSHTHA